MKTANLTTQLSDAQSQLASAKAERDAYIAKNNSLRFGYLVASRKTKVLGIDDSISMNVIRTMRPLTGTEPCKASVAIDDKLDARQGADIVKELRDTLELSGWTFGQMSKSFFPLGISIYSGEPSGHRRECALRLKDLLESLNVRPVNLNTDRDAELDQCHCIGIIFGKLESPQ